MGIECTAFSSGLSCADELVSIVINRVNLAKLAGTPGKVVQGHTICDLPQDLGHRINVDTGAFVSGRLTCLALAREEAAVHVDAGV